MNNRIFDNYDYQDMNMINEILLNNTNNINNSKIAGSYDGYIKGNLFNDLYDQYKNYKPSKLIPDNEQSELLLNINQIAFAMHDLRLYLDNFPTDRKMINLFNKYQQQLKLVIKEYEDVYGPILSDTISNGNIFNWVTYNWPWEGEDK